METKLESNDTGHVIGEVLSSREMSERMFSMSGHTWSNPLCSLGKDLLP
jgi:hypothetical protein